MGQNICRGYFVFDRTQMTEMVTWLAQYRETQFHHQRDTVSSEFQQFHQRHSFIIRETQFHQSDTVSFCGKRDATC